MSKLDLKIAEAACNLLAERDIEATAKMYSGRGMYGREVYGIFTNPGAEASIAWAIIRAYIDDQAAQYLHRHGQTDIPIETISEWIDEAHDLIPTNQDFMGNDRVYY